MKSLTKSLTAFLALAFMFILCAIGMLTLPACTSDGTSTNLSALNTKIDTALTSLSTDLANAYVNGNGSTILSSLASTGISTAQSNGDLDSTTASLITQAAPLVVSFIDTWAASHATASTATEASVETDSASKHLLVVKSKAIVNKELFSQELAAAIKAKFEEEIAKIKAKLNAATATTATTTATTATETKGIKRK